jgi:hypothetical protein
VDHCDEVGDPQREIEGVQDDATLDSTGGEMRSEGGRARRGGDRLIIELWRSEEIDMTEVFREFHGRARVRSLLSVLVNKICHTSESLDDEVRVWT